MPLDDCVWRCGGRRQLQEPRCEAVRTDRVPEMASTGERGFEGEGKSLALATLSQR